jgi:hypothetical protein
VLLDDLRLSALAALDRRRVIGVDQVRLGVELPDELIIGLSVRDRTKRRRRAARP